MPRILFEEELNKLQVEAYDHLWNGRFRLALNAAEKVYQARPDDSESAICLAWALLENGNPMKAMEYANLAVELKGDSVKARVYRAYLLNRMSIFEGALADIEHSVEDQKDILAWSYLNKSRSLAGLHKFEDALQTLEVGEIIAQNKNKTFLELKEWIYKAFDVATDKIKLNSRNVELYLDYARQAIKSKEYWFALFVSRKILSEHKSDEAELIEIESMLYLYQLKPALKKAEAVSGKFKKNEKFNSVFNALKRYSQLEIEYEISSQPTKKKTKEETKNNLRRTRLTEDVVDFKTNPIFFPNEFVEVISVKMFDTAEENVSRKRTYYKVFDPFASSIGAEVIFNNPFFGKAEKVYNCNAVWYLNDFEIGKNNFQLNVRKDWDTVIFAQSWGSDLESLWKMGQGKVEIYINNFKATEKYFGIGTQRILESEVQAPVTDQMRDDKSLKEKTQEQIKPRQVKPLEELINELNSYTGLNSIKEAVKNFIAYLEFLKERRRLGLKGEDKIAINAVFLGNPGTGKTTIARMLGDIFYALGILPSGHVVEVDRSALVGQYIGETAQKTEKLINDAIGGVLFIDEAYTLIKKGGSQDFGQEAIDILLKRMEDRKGEFVVIAAGYPEEMNSFLNSNPGLKSRFNHTFIFEDYTPDELLIIFKNLLAKEEYTLTAEAEEILKKEFMSLYRSRDKSFGNARLIKKFFEEAKLNLSRLYLEIPEESRTKELVTTFNENVINGVLAKSPSKSVKIPINEDALSECLNDLEKLVGLVSLKKQVNDMVRLARYLNEQGEDIKNVFNEHILFLGNPGTGKTTVARIFGKIYSALGILSKGHLVETDRQGLVAGFVGQTAEKTTAMIDKSLGGMLFIDEAYSLVKRNDSGNDFGKEAIDILLKRMEDDRGKFIVIAAGYTEEMQAFVASNPGIQSRFNRSFFFDDYSPSELMEIVQRSLELDKKKITSEARDKLVRHFEEIYKNRDKKFGNARIVRNILESVKQKMLLRLSELTPDERSVEKANTVELQDIIEVLSREVEAKQFEVKGDPLKLQESIDELNQLIGLEEVKNEIYKLISFAKLSQLKKEKGLQSLNRNLNAVFIGNPGTGKSTVTYILAKIYKELGVLKKGQVVSIERTDIVGGYQGQTAAKLEKIVQQSLDGILFIKNAPELFLNNPFAEETISTLFKLLEDYRNKFVLILAGAQEGFEQVRKNYPLLLRSIPNVFTFTDYSTRELLAISVSIAEKNGYNLDEGALQEMLDLFSKAGEEHPAANRNGLLAKNILYSAITNQEERIFTIFDKSDVDLTTITLEDVLKIKY